MDVVGHCASLTSRLRQQMSDARAYTRQYGQDDSDIADWT